MVHCVCLLILAGVPSATALLQHGTPFLCLLETVRRYIVSSAKSYFIAVHN